MTAKYKYVVDNKLKWSGDIDEEKKGVIRVNPRKGGLLNTILHEEIHRIHTKLTEKQVSKEASKQEKLLTIRKAISLLQKFDNGGHMGCSSKDKKARAARLRAMAGAQATSKETKVIK